MIGDHTSTTGPATGPTVVRGMAYVRAVNSRAVLALLRARDDGLTMAEVVEGTGLSRPALEGALDELASLGWVEETRGAASSPRGGRPARRFRFRAERGCVLGVDVGPSKIDVRLADLRGRMLAAGRVTPVADRELTPAAVHDAISSVVAERSAASRLEAVAIGVPGVVGADGELTNSFVLPGWERRPIRDEFERLLDAPVTMENDANLATLTELTLGAGRGASDLVYLLLGNRISSGVVVDGRLLRGAHGSAGEVGSLPRERWHEPIEAIMNGASTEAADADRGDLVGELFRRAAAGDEAAKELVSSYIAEVEFALITLMLTVDPEVVVVGGGVARAGAALLEPLRAAMSRHPLVRAEVRLGDYADDAVVIGAVQRALRHVDTEIHGLA